jgi:hypothetical protein
LLPVGWGLGHRLLLLEKTGLGHDADAPGC